MRFQKNYFFLNNWLRSFNFWLLVLLVFSCQDNQPVNETLVYSNDFEDESMNGLSINKMSFLSFNESKVLGNANNGGLELFLDQLPNHNYLVISMDLYIHDSWDGNYNGLTYPINDHDAWVIEFDSAQTRKVSEDIYFETTFSNGPCISYRCLVQSYPNIYPFVNNPQEGSTTTLPGLCLYADQLDGTTLYKFEKWFPHDRQEVSISIYDKLKQSNALDPQCDESWSIDNLSIKTIKLD